MILLKRIPINHWTILFFKIHEENIPVISSLGDENIDGKSDWLWLFIRVLVFYRGIGLMEKILILIVSTGSEKIRFHKTQSFRVSKYKILGKLKKIM